MWFVIDLKNLGEVSFRGILPFKNFPREKKNDKCNLKFLIRIFAKNQVGQALLGNLDSWSKFTLKPIVVELRYLNNFGFSNEEIDPKFRMYMKN